MKEEQEKIAELIVTNEATENQLTNLTFESNDVISYLKKLVEEKDEEVREKYSESEQRTSNFRQHGWRKCWMSR